MNSVIAPEDSTIKRRYLYETRTERPTMLVPPQKMRLEELSWWSPHLCGVNAGDSGTLWAVRMF